ncbi:hypothetical protein Fmac_032792 [Flemingia macrophylla]|uniref:Uncharacterized protein n=1 Tax=Flemingia macrophylla TaxID=520843 RepID=A0ABD1L5Y6_9FABA
MAPNSWQFNARNDAIFISGVHDVAPNISDATRKLEGKLDSLVNLQSGVDEHPETYAANTYSITTVAEISHLIEKMTPNSYLPLLEEPARSILPITAILVFVLLRRHMQWMGILRLMLQTHIADHHSSRDKALNTGDGSQLLALRIRSLPLLQESVASVLPMTTILVSVPLRSNMEWMSILRLMLQPPIVDHHSSKDKALDREDGSQLLEARKLEGKLDALVNLVTQLAANQKLASVAIVCDIRSSINHRTNDHSIRDKALDKEDDTSAENRKLEAKIDALVNLVTQLAANQKPAFVAKICGIRSSNDHHTSVCPSSQQSGVDEHLEAYVANTYSRPPQHQGQGTG